MLAAILNDMFEFNAAREMMESVLPWVGFFFTPLALMASVGN